MLLRVEERRIVAAEVAVQAEEVMTHLQVEEEDQALHQVVAGALLRAMDAEKILREAGVAAVIEVPAVITEEKAVAPVAGKVPAAEAGKEHLKNQFIVYGKTDQT